MKLKLTIASVAMLAIANLFAAAQAQEETVEVFTYDGSRHESTVKVKYKPSSIAVIDFTALDILDSLGLGGNVTALTKTATVPYLKQYAQNDKLINLGTVKEVDLENLMSAKPDVIFISGRLASKYDELSKIAPVVFLATDYSKSTLDNVKRNVKTIASLYGLEDAAGEQIAKYEQRLESLKAKTQGKTAVIGLVTAAHFNTLGNNGRCSMIGRDLGFDNLAKDIAATHGNESSFELLPKLNPEYIFVLDRDSAIARPGAKLASDLMNNELTAKTKAYKEGHIVYLTSYAWYLAEGGLKSMDIMLGDIEKVFE